MLVIDNDPQGSMTASLGYHNPDELPITLATILTKIVEDEPFENTLGILHHQEGIDLIPANIELSGMEGSLVNIMSTTVVFVLLPHIGMGIVAVIEVVKCGLQEFIFG